MIKRLKICALLSVLLLLLCSCGSDKAALRQALDDVSLTAELPAVKVTGCRYLSEADDAVYEQQIAACEMYSEAYELTETQAYSKTYKKGLKKKNVAYYCNLRRQELQLDIATQLNDNVYEMIKSVEDCENISAYLTRVNYDAVNFYDYYTEYMKAEKDDNDPACRILMYFYERNNVLALRFMREHRADFIEKAVNKIVANSHETEELNQHISVNNELVKALNTVYGGVPAEQGEIITMANIELVRRLLEEDNDLDADTIDSLMRQLGEPTPEPTMEPTPEPTEEPTQAPEDPTEAPAALPSTGNAATPPRATSRPATPAPAPVVPTPEVYMFE